MNCRKFFVSRLENLEIPRHTRARASLSSRVDAFARSTVTREPCARPNRARASIDGCARPHSSRTRRQLVFFEFSRFSHPRPRRASRATPRADD